jgi:hypothetical protein
MEMSMKKMCVHRIMQRAVLEKIKICSYHSVKNHLQVTDHKKFFVEEVVNAAILRNLAVLPKMEHKML